MGCTLPRLYALLFFGEIAKHKLMVRVQNARTSLRSESKLGRLRIPKAEENR